VQIKEIKMKAKIRLLEQEWEVDFETPLDISQALSHDENVPKCFGAEAPKFVPMSGEGWVAKVSQGGSVNAFTVKFNPHGNGTHTECYGHISESHDSISDQKIPDHILSQLITVSPQKVGEDRVITESILTAALRDKPRVPALLIRTEPNKIDDKKKDFTGTNPSYLSVEAMTYLVEKGIEHLLIDLPSVDKEEDGGKVACHKVFWNWPKYQGRRHCTITEMIYVRPEINDGLYLLNLQRASFDLDCSPSRPVLFPIVKI